MLFKFHFLKRSAGDRKGGLKTSRKSATRCRSFVPRLEALEDRSLPSTFTVTNLNDSGPGSLRAAVLAANAHPGPDTINFKPGLTGTIKLTSGELAVTDSVNIQGPGALQITVSGNHASRIFDISGGASVQISGLTVANGLASQGGGILNQTGSTLSLTHDILANNQAQGGLGGGGILNETGANLSVTSSVVASNQAIAATGMDVFGGGLLNEGSANVTSSGFKGNQALAGASFTFFGGSIGGAIDNFGGATLTVTGSTFVNNQAISAGGPFFGIGGAIENNSGFDNAHPSTANISYSLFTGNLATGGAGATGNGGAIDNEGAGASMTLSNSVLLSNQSNGGPGGGEGRGGGLMNVFGSALTVLDSLFAGNRAVGGAGATGLFPATVDGRGIGGGIDNEFGSTLSARNTTLTGNQALGGADSTFGGTLTTSNVGDGDGGGIANGDGPGGALNPGLNGGGAILTLINSSVNNNLAHGGATNTGRGGTVQGGGIVNMSGTLTVINSLLAGNRAIGGVGGSGFQTGFGLGGGLEDLAGGNASVLGSKLIGNGAMGAAGGSGTNGGNGVGGGISLGTFG
jgi:hypothetical protein